MPLISRLATAIVCAAPAAAMMSLVGCGFVPKTDYNACQSQARILEEQSKAQLSEIANLKAHSRKLEDQLLQAEKELAGQEQRSAADQKRLANFQVERDRVQEQLDGLVNGAKITGVAPIRDDDVESLTKRFPLLRFDSLSGAYKLDADVLFSGRDARIAPDSQKLLTEFATLFTQPEGRDLRVMVVGRTATAGGSKESNGAKPIAGEHRLATDRALAVADFLRKVGLKGEQIGVSGVAGSTPSAGSKSNAPAGSSDHVEIFVMGKRTPIVGWEETSPRR